MRFWCTRTLLIAGLCLGALPAARADDALAAAYSAILKGDYDAGRSAVNRVLDTDPASDEAKALSGWLDSLRNIRSSRADLLKRTFEWNLDEARKARTAGNLRLALSFAAQAAPYAATPGAFRQDPWIQDLTAKALEAAQAEEAAHKWTRALWWYMQLERIHEGDENLKNYRERAARHARLDALYSDKESVDRRIKGADPALLAAAVRQIESLYYESPDFRAMAEGALDNLISLTESDKLKNVFDGLGNPAARQLFLDAVAQEMKDLRAAQRFDHRDLQRLFRRLLTKSDQSISLPHGVLVIEFVEGALHRLDEFTSMVWPADSTEFDKLMMGEFRGVGIQLGVDEGTGRLKVVTPLEDSPALEAGIQPDDLIIEVDGKSTEGWSTEDAVRTITGEAGTEVKLTIFRPSTAEHNIYPLVRREIHLRSVRGLTRDPARGADAWNYMLDAARGIAYVKISGFNSNTVEELARALDDAKRQGMRGLILDLRFNPGGLLEVVIEEVSAFLQRGEVVSTRGRRESGQVHEVSGSASFADLPMVILVNEGSASASEILSGALQDHNRALVLGERTFGKGSVQRVLQIGVDARLKLTTALYYLPSGRTPHKRKDSDTWGVEPDYELVLTPKEVRRIIERERDSAIIQNRSVTPARQPTDEERAAKLAELKKHEDREKADEDAPLLSDADLTALDADPHKAPDVDPQLEEALMKLRAKLATNQPWPRTVAARASGAEKSDKP